MYPEDRAYEKDRRTEAAARVDQKEAEMRTPFDEVVDQHRVVIEQARNELAHLARRLGPVLRPTPPPETVDKEARTLDAPALDIIRALSRDVQSLAQQLIDLNKRLVV